MDKEKNSLKRSGKKKLQEKMVERVIERSKLNISLHLSGEKQENYRQYV